MNKNHPIKAAETRYLHCTELLWAFVANLARAAPTKCIFEYLTVTLTSLRCVSLSRHSATFKQHGVMGSSRDKTWGTNI